MPQTLGFFLFKMPFIS